LPLFLAPTDQLDSGTVVLAGAEGRHAAAARRLRPGEHVELSDGAGLLASCVVSAVSGSSVTFDVLDRRAVPRPEPRLVVVQAIPKGDRGELAVETMTEAGVDTVVPWPADRCVVQWRSERAARGVQRWRSAGIQASKQSGRAWLPEVTAPASGEQVASRIAAASVAVLLEACAPTALSSVALPGAGEIVVVVGPEGGITPRERELFIAAGATQCRLGPTVLRTSTAGVAAAAVIFARTGRW
jgi:16S rRNA (uracil1498-N3)-methyltransferase